MPVYGHYDYKETPFLAMYVTEVGGTYVPFIEEVVNHLHRLLGDDGFVAMYYRGTIYASLDEKDMKYRAITLRALAHFTRRFLVTLLQDVVEGFLVILPLVQKVSVSWITPRYSIVRGHIPRIRVLVSLIGEVDGRDLYADLDSLLGGRRVPETEPAKAIALYLTVTLNRYIDGIKSPEDLRQAIDKALPEVSRLLADYSGEGYTMIVEADVVYEGISALYVYSSYEGGVGRASGALFSSSWGVVGRGVASPGLARALIGRFGEVTGFTPPNRVVELGAFTIPRHVLRR